MLHLLKIVQNIEIPVLIGYNYGNSYIMFLIFFFPPASSRPFPPDSWPQVKPAESVQGCLYVYDFRVKHLAFDNYLFRRPCLNSCYSPVNFHLRLELHEISPIHLSMSVGVSLLWYCLGNVLLIFYGCNPPVTRHTQQTSWSSGLQSFCHSVP